MNKKINLKEIERKAFRAYHNDGLIDIGLGLVLLLLGLFIGLDSAGSAWWVFIIIALVFPLYYEFKKHMTAPRLGTVNFSRDRKVTENQKWLIYGVVVMVLILVATALLYAYLYTVRKDMYGGWHDLIRANFVMLMGALVALAIAAGAPIFEIGRFYLYAALVLASFLAARLIAFPNPILFGLAVPGILILAAGIVIMAKFMKDNPVILVPADGA